MKNLFLPGFLVVCLPLLVKAEVAGPYASDAFTIGLYHFDESSGSIINYGIGGASLDGGDTGGATGRGGGGGGYGGSAFSGFGSAFDVLASGTGNYHATQNDDGGGVVTSAGVLQSALQGSDGAFTLEALINLRQIAANTEYTILSHDGAGTNRGFLFRINNGGTLSFYSGGVSSAIDIALPSTGDHAFVPNEWFHVALSYNGNAGVANNTSLYWTALNSSATTANLLGTGTLGADLSSSVNNLLGFGTTTRNPFRFELDGFIDEVRISSIARTADEFLFVPEPSPGLLIGFAGLLWTCVRGRRS